MGLHSVVERQECGSVEVYQKGWEKHGSIYSPKRGQRASIFSLISVDISITSGHSLLNPSAGSFFVQSNPTFDPNPMARELWSSTSIGPRVTSMSRSGSILFESLQTHSAVSCTFTSSSNTKIILVNIICPRPHIAFITLNAWPGYRFLMLTNARL